MIADRPAADKVEIESREIDSPRDRASINLAQSTEAEIANSITHGLGLLFSVVASIILLTAARDVGAGRFAAYAIYAAAMIAVYAASTASHVVWQPKLRQFL